MLSKKRLVLGLVLGLLLLASLACASGNELEGVPDSNKHISGFFNGLWHGLVFFLSVCCQITGNGMGVYDAHNNGIPYNVGFAIGIAVFWLIIGTILETASS